ncbi:MAG: hypothetical protein JW927_02365 [Deltaproteobacteria bacterium]|nr:hypothetical protein [Deltaproteobacteria bacterium]
MAGMMFFHNSKRPHENPDIEDVVYSLNLQKDHESRVLECIRRFRIEIEKQDEKSNAVRDSVVSLASKSGPLDQGLLNQLNETMNKEEISKNALFKTHVTELRNLLGDEKGALFYTLLQEHIKNINKLHRR